MSFLTGGSSRALDNAAPQRFKINGVFFGDSQTDNGIYINPNSYPKNWGKGYIDNYSRSWGYMSWLPLLSRGNIRIIRNYACQTNGLLIPGTNPVGYPLSRQVSIFLADPLALTANRAFIEIGQSDAGIQVNGQYLTIAQCLTELETQIARLKMPVTLITSMPKGGIPTGVVADGMALWIWLLEWRKACQSLANNSKGWITFVDAYPLVNSNTVPDTLPVSMSYDTIHTNSASAFLTANAVVKAHIPPDMPADVPWPAPGYNGSTNGAALDQGFSNPTFSGTAGVAGAGVTLGAGSITTGLTLSGVAGGTVAGGNANVLPSDIPDSRGNMQSCLIDCAAAGDGLTYEFADSAGPNFLSAGDTAIAFMLARINYTGFVLPRNLYFRLLAFVNPINHVGLQHEQNAINEVSLPITQSLVVLLQTPPVTPPGTPTVLQTRFRPVSGSAGQMSIDVSNLTILRFKNGVSY